jgi:hypothetical protein
MTPRQLKIALAAGFALAFLIGWMLWRRHERRRHDRLEALAADMGLAYAARDDALLQALRGRMPLFDRGRRRQTRSAMAGAIEDLRVCIFDYHYTTGGGRSSTTWRQTVVAFELPEGRLPAFSLRPQRFFHKIAEKLGWTDIDFADHPEFSRRYRLTGDDEVAVRAAFSGELIELLDRDERLCVESDGRWLVVYRHGRRVRPDRVPALLEEAFEICNRLA